MNTKLLRKYKADGAVLVKNCFEIETIKKIEMLLREDAETRTRQFENKHSLRSIADYAGTFEDLDKNDQMTLTGNFPADIKGHSMLTSLFENCEVQALLKNALCSNELFMHMYPSPRYIESGNKHAMVPVHIDRQYNSHLINFLTAWVPIDASDPEQGGVEFYSQSHQQEDDPSATDTMKAGWFTPRQVSDKYKKKAFSVKAGDLVLLHPNVLHGSAPNLSNKPRISIDFRIFDKSDQTSKHYYDLQIRQIKEPSKA